MSEPAVDQDGFVIGGVLYVETLLEGDIITTESPAQSIWPMLYRVTGGLIRNEYGASHPQGLLPKPWRLLWRDPGNPVATQAIPNVADKD